MGAGVHRLKTPHSLVLRPAVAGGGTSLRQQRPAVHSLRLEPLQQLHLLPLVPALDQDQELLRHRVVHPAAAPKIDNGKGGAPP